ncbi:MAG: hypothetical protein JKY22_12140 [Flavobacteriaceae bacterium]|nr:hypothetical protein [Flavobacteriaceae bacterium]PCJ26498.1 MAG: hypothetical protein COA94_05155 [Rickettsiales bacterium]
MARFNPLADFAGGKSSALGIKSQEQGIAREAAAAPVRNQLAQIQLQQAQTGQRREGQQFDQEQALRRIKLLNQGAKAIGATDPSQWQQAIPRVVQFLGAQGVDAQELAQGVTPESLTSFIAQTDEFLRDPSKLTSAQKEFASLTEGFSPEDKIKTRRVKAGIDPRAVGSAIQTISAKNMAADIAKTEGTIAEGKEFGKLTGSSRAKAIDSGFDKIQSISKNIDNINKAIEEIDAGASTGAIESRFFPSIRASTVALEQIQSELALDVVGATTFGALSKGELDLAKEVALPTKLEPAELKKFLVDKKSAQEKLMAYYQEQIDFIDQGGTKAGFLRSKERGVSTGQEGQIMVDAQGNRARVFKDGTFEEL